LESLGLKSLMKKKNNEENNEEEWSDSGEKVVIDPSTLPPKKFIPFPTR